MGEYSEGLSLLALLDHFLDTLSYLMWGPYVLIPLLLGVGAILSIGLRFLPWRKMPHAFATIWKRRHHTPGHEGELTPFRALMTSFGTTIGAGSIVGVSSAILLGGPGAVFWMWMTALFGMATKFCETTLAVRFREVAPDGSFVGGPMYYIKNGLGPNWKWLAAVFAVFGLIASFGIGNMVQTNAVAENVIHLTRELYNRDIPPVAVAVVLLTFSSLALIGGIRHINTVVTSILLPIMAAVYVIGGIVVLALNAHKVPGAFGLIFSSAFTGQAAVGGFAGAALAEAIRFGVARGLCSNEAGLGSSSIAHATSITKHPVRQGMLGMLDPFLDTLIVCTISASVILVSGEWMAGGMQETGKVTLTAVAFSEALPVFRPVGLWLVTVCLTLFAFSAILGWCVYGERCAVYLFGHKMALPFRIIFTLAIPIGTLTSVDTVWSLSDLFNGLMALPNLVGLLLLSPVVFALTRNYLSDPKNADNYIEETGEKAP